MTEPADLVWERRLVVARFVLGGLAGGACAAASDQREKPIGLLAVMGVPVVAVILSWPWRLQDESARGMQLVRAVQPGPFPFWGLMGGLAAGQLVFGALGLGVRTLYTWSLGLWLVGLWLTRRQLQRFPAGPEVDFESRRTKTSLWHVAIGLGAGLVSALVLMSALWR